MRLKPDQPRGCFALRKSEGRRTVRLESALAMSIKPLVLTTLAGIALAACHLNPARSDRDLVRDWSAPGLSPRERAAVVNRFFTNGTPVTTIVAVLGPDYIRAMPYSMVSLD